MRTTALISSLPLLSILAAAAGETESVWPAPIEAGDRIVTLYQPQVDSFEGDSLEARAAVSVKRADGAGEPVFGAVWLSATMDIDRERRLMTVRELAVPRVRFADSTEEARAALASLLEEEIPKWELTLDLDQMVTDLDADPEYATTPGIRSDPPSFIHVTEPAVLLQYDGEPITRPMSQAPGLEQVVNTPFPVIRESGGDLFYLFGGEGYWYSAVEPLGPWQPTGSVPQPIRDLMRPSEPVADESGTLEEGAAPVPPPKIVVATEPTELVITQGEPKWVLIGDLDLLYCENTDADVFLDLASQSYYILASGRWFAGKAVEDSFIWANVANDALPEAFSHIPEDSVNGHVLAHVSGTEQAREEALQNTIPQTAAVNTTASVFVVDGLYWACDNAIWYSAPAAGGPWSVATEIPAVLYRIPASNPRHNVTYVHIYETTPQVVYVGYTPGYVGSYWYRGCVVWGTGWYYDPWYGPYYYPRPGPGASTFTTTPGTAGASV